MEKNITLYSVISGMVSPENNLIFHKGYGYKTEIRSYKLYVIKKNNDVYTVEDLNEEEFEGTIEELCELASSCELQPDWWGEEKEGFIINGEIDNEFKFDSDEDPEINYKYGERFYKSYDEADSDFNETQSSFVKLYQNQNN